MKKLTILGVALALVTFACDSSSGGAGSQAVTIQFAAKVGAAEFVCGEVYDNLGADGTSLQLGDFRFYVQDIELKNANGDYVAVALDTDDNIWQTSNVTLLDFEDGCNDAGTPATNSVVTGTVPAGAYDGIRFKMGVPFELNHENPAVASPPLNLTTMQWNWQGGYKFLRVDSGDSQLGDTDWRMHLGSTACDGDPVGGGTTACGAPNRTDVEAAPFDPSSDTIVADLAALVDGAQLDVNQPETPFGCMSGPMDSDCAVLFENLGLPFAGAEPSTQQFFSVE